MSEKTKSPSQPSPISASKGKVVHLTVDTAYKNLRKTNPQLPEPATYSAGHILIQENIRYADPCAAFVLQGELQERQTQYATSGGHQMHTVAIIKPGGVAFVQALYARFASDPADVTVIAHEESVVIWIGPEHIEFLKRYGLIMEINFEARRQAQQSLVDLRLAYQLQQPFVEYAAKLKQQRGIEISPDKIFEILFKAYIALPKIKKDLATALQTKIQEAAMLADASKEIAKLKKELETAKAQVKRLATANNDLLEEHTAATKEVSERASARFLAISSLLVNIQSGLATLGLTLDKLGITERDRQVLSETVPLSGNLDNLFDQIPGEDNNKSGPIAEPDEPAPISMPKINKTEPEISAAGRAPSIRQTARYYLAPEIRKKFLKDYEDS